MKRACQFACFALCCAAAVANESAAPSGDTPAVPQNTPQSALENAELIQALQEHAKSVYRRLPAMDRLYVHGGPGFSRDTAWVVDGAELSQAPAAVVRLMYFIYDDEERFPVIALDQDRLEIDGRIYLYTNNTILYKGEPYSVEQWVDISAYWRE